MLYARAPLPVTSIPWVSVRSRTLTRSPGGHVHRVAAQVSIPSKLRSRTRGPERLPGLRADEPRPGTPGKVADLSGLAQLSTTVSVPCMVARGIICPGGDLGPGPAPRHGGALEGGLVPVRGGRARSLLPIPARPAWRGTRHGMFGPGAPRPTWRPPGDDRIAFGPEPTVGAGLRLGPATGHRPERQDGDGCRGGAASSRSTLSQPGRPATPGIWAGRGVGPAPRQGRLPASPGPPRIDPAG